MLDHQLFPHVFEKIVRFAPPESLLVLRSCCRDTRALADARLFAHLEVSFSTSIPTLTRPFHVLVQPHGSSLSFEWLDYSISTVSFDLLNPLMVALTDQEHADLASRRTLQAHVQNLVRGARRLDLPLVDYDIPLRHESLPAAIAPRYNDSGQGTVRRFGARPNVDLKPRKFILRRLTDDGHRDSYVDVVRLKRGDIADKVNRVVKLGETLGDAPCLDQWVVRLLQRDPRSAEEMKKTKKDEETREGDNEGDGEAGEGEEEEDKGEGEKTVLEQLFWMPFGLCVRFRGATLASFVTTVVGGGEEMRIALDIDPQASNDDFYTALNKAVHEWSAKLHSTIWQIWAFWPDHLRFVTPQEYEAEVGAEQVAIETKADPFDGVLVSYIK